MSLEACAVSTTIIVHPILCEHRLYSHPSPQERLLLQHEQSMLRVRRQALMKHPTPSACSIMLQQQSCEYAKKLQTVSYDVNKEQLLLTMGEKVCVCW